MLPAEGDKEGIFEDSSLELTISNTTVIVPIKAVSILCNVKSVGFQTKSVAVEYEIGSGSVQADLPSIVQKPDCGLPLNKIIVKSKTSNLAEDVLASAVTIDTDLGAIIMVTDDITLNGEQVSIVLSIDVADSDPPIEAKELFYDIVFKAKDPEFDMSSI